MELLRFRKLDKLGRIVIPIKIRRKLDIRVNEDVEIYVSSESIVIRKYRPVCIFCGETEKVGSVHNKLICKYCLSDLKSL